MQLLEVKNDIAKIIYNSAENHLLPSDFLLLEDTNQKLIAQITDISTTETSDNNLADARLSLSIDKNDNLSYYNGYIPSKTSSVVYINSDEIIELIKGSYISVTAKIFKYFIIKIYQFIKKYLIHSLLS